MFINLGCISFWTQPLASKELPFYFTHHHTKETKVRHLVIKSLNIMIETPYKPANLAEETDKTHGTP